MGRRLDGRRRDTGSAAGASSATKPASAEDASCMPASEEALRAAACTSNDSLLRSARSCKNAGSPMGGCAKEFSTRRSSTLRGGMAQVWPARASSCEAAGASSETAACSSGDAPAGADGAETDSAGRSKPGAFTSMMPARVCCSLCSVSEATARFASEKWDALSLMAASSASA